MIKYILFIILGIIIFILLNNVNSFSIGVPYETETRTFYNPDIAFIPPQDIEYIKWSELETTLPSLDRYTADENIPPIYLGRFKKDPEPDGHDLGFGWRHFFIIEKKLYYFEEITVNDRPMLKPKNYGERNREAIVLISEVQIRDLRSAVPDYNAIQYEVAVLEVTQRNIGKSYLTIRGTNEKVIRMYNNIKNVHKASNIINEYTEFVIRNTGNIRSCSVNFSSNPNYRGTIGTPDLIQLLDSPSITAPRYSIDLSTIVNYGDGTIGSTICDSYDSVIKLNLNEVTVSDTTSDNVILEYRGVLLIHTEIIGSGSFGTVVVVSNIPYSQFQRSANEGRVAIALILKMYVNQNDPEIALIESINNREIQLSNCLQVGELVGARILDTQKPIIGKIAIMDIMDNNLFILVRDPDYNYNVNSNLPLEIINRIYIMLKCIKDVGYSYTDLKLKNILFKCYKDRQLLITMGDLGSIVSSDQTDDVPWTNMAPFNEDGFTKDNGVVWIFGLVIIELYKIVLWDINDIYDRPYDIPDMLKILNPNENWYQGRYADFESGDDGYFAEVEVAVTHLMGLFDGIKNDTNNDQIEFIKDLLRRIFVSVSEGRITLEGIHQELTSFSERQMGGEPVTVPECSQLTEIECRRHPDFCNWDGSNCNTNM